MFLKFMVLVDGLAIGHADFYEKLFKVRGGHYSPLLL